MSDQFFTDPTEDIEDEFDALIEELRMEIGAQNDAPDRETTAPPPEEIGRAHV